MADDDLPIGDPSDDAPEGVDPTITAYGLSLIHISEPTRPY